MSDMRAPPHHEIKKITVSALKWDFSSIEFIEEPPKVVPTVTYNVGGSIKDVNLIPNTPDPVCLADDQYPSWLWSFLDEKLNPDWRKKAKQTRKKYIRERNQFVK